MSIKEEFESRIKNISLKIHEKLYSIRSAGLKSRKEGNESPLQELDNKLDKLISKKTISDANSARLATAGLILNTKEDLAISTISELFNTKNQEVNLFFSAKMLETKISKSIEGVAGPAIILPMNDPKTGLPDSTDLLLVALLNSALAEREHKNGNHELSQFYLINAIASQNHYTQMQQESATLSSRAAKGAEAKNAQLRDLMDKIFTTLGDEFIKNSDTKSIIKAVELLPTQEFAAEINKNYPLYKISKCPESRSLARRIETKKKELGSDATER